LEVLRASEVAKNLTVVGRFVQAITDTLARDVNIGSREIASHLNRKQFFGRRFDPRQAMLEGRLCDQFENTDASSSTNLLLFVISPTSPPY
jgi:hypothetical protein